MKNLNNQKEHNAIQSIPEIKDIVKVKEADLHRFMNLPVANVTDIYILNAFAIPKAPSKHRTGINSMENNRMASIIQRNTQHARRRRSVERRTRN